MEQNKFINVWNALHDYKMYSDNLYKDYGINLIKHDNQLYNIIIMLLKTYYTQEQVDLFIFSIYDKDKLINDIEINNAELCFEYINKITEHEEI
jgi:hypothetical protein